MARHQSVQTIINSTAAELGLTPVADVLASVDQNFLQLRYLLDAVGQELVLLDDWEELQEEHAITTTAADDGDYPLPTDFSHMINQTGWDRTNDLPLQGPLSPQQWAYAKGRELVSQTVYVSFRLKQGKFHVYPDSPVPDALDVRFEYCRNTWLQDAEEETTKHTEIMQATDIVLFPPILVKKFLKVKYLEAKGFDSKGASDSFADMFESTTGKDGAAPVLNAGGTRNFPYLETIRNTTDSGYGS